MSVLIITYIFFFFFNDPATTEIYTLSLHDALPILEEYRMVVRIIDDLEILLNCSIRDLRPWKDQANRDMYVLHTESPEDRKSTRLNSSHSQISYAVFCLKKKNQKRRQIYRHVIVRH